MNAYLNNDEDTDREKKHSGYDKNLSLIKRKYCTDEVYNVFFGHNVAFLIYNFLWACYKEHTMGRLRMCEKAILRRVL